MGMLPVASPLQFIASALQTPRTGCQSLAVEFLLLPGDPPERDGDAFVRLDEVHLDRRADLHLVGVDAGDVAHHPRAFFEINGGDDERQPLDFERLGTPFWRITVNE